MLTEKESITLAQVLLMFEGWKDIGNVFEEVMLHLEKVFSFSDNKNINKNNHSIKIMIPSSHF